MKAEAIAGLMSALRRRDLARVLMSIADVRCRLRPAIFVAVDVDGGRLRNSHGREIAYALYEHPDEIVGGIVAVEDRHGRVMAVKVSAIERRVFGVWVVVGSEVGQ